MLEATNTKEKVAALKLKVNVQRSSFILPSFWLPAPRMQVITCVCCFRVLVLYFCSS